MLYALNKKNEYEEKETFIFESEKDFKNISDIITYISGRYRDFNGTGDVPVRLIALIMEKHYRCRVKAFKKPVPEALLKEVFSKEWDGVTLFHWMKADIMAVDAYFVANRGAAYSVGLDPAEIFIDRDTEDAILNDIITFWNHHKRTDAVPAV